MRSTVAGISSLNCGDNPRSTRDAVTAARTALNADKASNRGGSPTAFAPRTGSKSMVSPNGESLRSSTLNSMGMSLFKQGLYSHVSATQQQKQPHATICVCSGNHGSDHQYAISSVSVSVILVSVLPRATKGSPCEWLKPFVGSIITSS